MRIEQYGIPEEYIMHFPLMSRFLKITYANPAAKVLMNSLG